MRNTQKHVPRFIPLSRRLLNGRVSFNLKPEEGVCEFTAQGALDEVLQGLLKLLMSFLRQR